MTEKPIADNETAQCWRNDPHQPHTWTWRPEDGGAGCPGITTPAPAETQTAGGPDECSGCRYVPCGNCTPAPDPLRQQYAAAIHRYDYEHGLSGNDIPSAHHRGEADAVLAVRDTELQQLRDLLGEAVGWIHEGELRERICAELNPPQEPTPPAVHIGGNAEDCPACSAVDDPSPYPWICPGPDQPARDR